MKILFLFFPLFLWANCPFCNSDVLDQQSIYETEDIVVLYSYKPLLKGHILLVPKRHVTRFEDLTEKEAASLFQITKKIHRSVSKLYQTQDYILLQKNGKSVGQTVDHVHMHYIPRKKEKSAYAFLCNFFRRILSKVRHQLIHFLHAFFAFWK